MRIKELDGLRGIAVLAVIDCHYLVWFPALGSSYGWLGVDLFFVLSGFLITSILLGLRSRKDYFAIFYSRRALRIFPPYYLGLLFYFVVSLIRGLPGTLGLWSPYLFYYVSLNLHDAVPKSEVSGGVPLAVSFGLTVLWSLSVEEIFYLIWAPIVRFVSGKGLAIILALMIVGSPLLRCWLFTPRQIEIFTFYCRMDGLAYGAVVALLVHYRLHSEHGWPGLDRAFDRVTIIFIPLAILFELIIGGNPSTLLVCALGISVADISFALLTYALVRHSGENKLVVKIFRAKWLCSIGMVSYSLYLFHNPLLIVSEDIFARLHLPRRVGAVGTDLLALAMSFAVAYGLWYGMESRILRWKDRLVPSPAHPGAV